MAKTTYTKHLTSENQKQLQDSIQTMMDVFEKTAKELYNKNPTDAVDQIGRASFKGSISDSVHHHFYGFNHRQTSIWLPHNIDQMGYVFFIRPTLNLSYKNIVSARRSRLFLPLLNPNPMSYGRIVRALLDPRLARESKYRSPAVDPYNVFIPFLSNSIQNMSNPPSSTMGVYTSQAGMAKEVFAMADDIFEDYSTYNISCSFRNMQGSPFLLLFRTWMLMMSLQFMGDGPVPYSDDTMNNRMNYTTRIYRLVMDPTKQYVQHIWAPMYCFPTGMETGAIFGYDATKPYNDSLASVDIQFQCVASIWNDPLLIEQFNTSVFMMNPNMKPGVRSTKMIRIENQLLPIFNGRGYPFINIEKDNALEWWIDHQTFKAYQEEAKNHSKISGIRIK